MTVLAVEAPQLLGSETPRLWTRPLRELTPETSLGFEVCEFSERVLEIDLLPWQKWLFIHGLELKPDGLFRFRTVLVLVARQNGKTTAVMVLSLWRLVMDQARMILGTSTNLEYARLSWKKAVELAWGPRGAKSFDGVAGLEGEFFEPRYANGQESLQHVSGGEYRIGTASRTGGRSMSNDLLILDELREHKTWEAWSASSKTTNARPRGQRWALSNAGDDSSVVLNYLRDVALKGKDPGTFIAEWSADPDLPIDDRAGWAQANPAKGYTISEDSLASDLATDADEVFRTEVLCQRVPTLVPLPLTVDMWRKQLDVESMIKVDDPVVFSVEVALDHKSASIGVAGWRPDGAAHVGLIAQDYGTDWVLPRLLELVEANKTYTIERGGRKCDGLVVDPSSPAVALVDPLRAAKVEPVLMTSRDVASAWGDLQDACVQGTVWHRDQPLVDVALAGAVKRDLGDGGWALGRRKSAAVSVDATPATCVANARWGLSVVSRRRGPAIF